MTEPRWYMVNKDGMATLCTDRADAEKEAEDAQSVWPHMGPHRAVQLVEVADVEALRTGYAAARLEIESLQARIKAMAEEHADELMVAHMDGRMRAEQAIPGVQWQCGPQANGFTAPQADSQPAGADRHGLPPLPDPDLRDVGTTPRDIKEFLRGYATEYAKAALAARAPADSVLEDAERYRWLRLALADRTNNGKSHWFCSIAAGHPEELDAAIDAARKQGANHD